MNRPWTNPSVLQAARDLDIRARRSLPTTMFGNHRTNMRGNGMQFKEFRRYEPGDDIRHMSWTLTARTGNPTIKVYEEDREIDVLVGIDTSGSSRFGGSRNSKRQMYLDVAATLGLAAVRGGNNFGVFFFQDAIESYLPPRRNRATIRTAVDRLLHDGPPGRRSDLNPVFRVLSSTLKRRTLLILLSDFLMPDFRAGLAAMTQRHEVLLLQSVSDWEQGLGEFGLWETCDPETGEFGVIDGRSVVTRKLLAEEFAARSRAIESTARENAAAYGVLSTEDNYLQRLVHFFRAR